MRQTEVWIRTLPLVTKEVKDDLKHIMSLFSLWKLLITFTGKQTVFRGGTTEKVKLTLKIDIFQHIYSIWNDLEKWLFTGTVLSLGDIWQSLEMFTGCWQLGKTWLTVANRGQGCCQPPTMHRTGLVTNDLAPNASSAEVEKPYLEIHECWHMWYIVCAWKYLIRVYSV